MADADSSDLGKAMAKTKGHNYLTTGQAKIIGIGREVVGRRNPDLP